MFDLFSLGRAREALISRSLVAYDPRLYQLLSLPERPLTLKEDEVEKEGYKRKLCYIRR